MPAIACVAVELPVDDQPLVGGDAPEHVEHRCRDSCVGRRPPVGVGRHGRGAAPRAGAGRCAVRVGSSGGRGASGWAATRSRRCAAVTSATSSSASPARSMPGLLLEALHDRVAQPALVGEVAVDRAFVHAGALGDAPGSVSAVPVRIDEAVQQLAAGGDDPLAGLGRPLAAQRAVVPAPLRRGSAARVTGARPAASPSPARSRSAASLAPVPVDLPLGEALRAPRRARPGPRAGPARRRGRSGCRSRT